ncbi:MAG TPA: MarR family transcriptional regulator [Tenuifilaceae bacterium]|jgi:DNA-binding MarR family transcriptional regulator|nr:MarR family transcriptional regulator [Bacteroidales bacterium]HNY08306.1 MarR family transcriptional regulator [Tenuifilaceae bacterium]MBP8644229.1 MarR family transcriptional regulator [Bacteroidales bacterium]NLI87993.1 MarR family transcriptional regulator [Bacteroidales bacterium]HOA08676.1 MarR family transcriptional regulator [Tenuifilaceae bacterium]
MESMEKVIAGLSNMIGDAEEKAKEQFNTLNLTITQMHYLETINLLGNPNITELSAQLKLSKPTVTVSVDKLIEKGCVYKIQSDEDRRSAHIHLTEKGKLVNQMHDYAHRKIAEMVKNRLSAEELTLLERLLSKVLVE